MFAVLYIMGLHWSCVDAIRQLLWSVTRSQCTAWVHHGCFCTSNIWWSWPINVGHWLCLLLAVILFIPTLPDGLAELNPVGRLFRMWTLEGRDQSSLKICTVRTMIRLESLLNTCANTICSSASRRTRTCTEPAWKYYNPWYWPCSATSL